VRIHAAENQGKLPHRWPLRICRCQRSVTGKPFIYEVMDGWRSFRGTAPTDLKNDPTHRVYEVRSDRRPSGGIHRGCGWVFWLGIRYFPLDLLPIRPFILRQDRRQHSAVILLLFPSDATFNILRTRRSRLRRTETPLQLAQGI